MFIKEMVKLAMSEVIPQCTWKPSCNFGILELTQFLSQKESNEIVWGMHQNLKHVYCQYSTVLMSKYHDLREPKSGSLKWRNLPTRKLPA